MESTINWIEKCQNIDGGFGLYPGDSSNLLATYSAVSALQLLNKEVKNKHKIQTFVLSRQINELGFANRWGNWPNEPSLEYTFYALSILFKINKLPKNTDIIVEWIHSKQYTDGGYIWDYWIPDTWNNRSSLTSCYYAIKSLDILQSKPQNMNLLKVFLNNRQLETQHQDGSFNVIADSSNTDTPRSLGLVVFTGMGLELLEMLNLMPWNKGKTIEYLKSKQESNGGISKGLAEYKCYNDRGVTRLVDAYYGIIGLGVLNQELQDKVGLIEWISKCQNNDGGFGLNADFCPSDLDSTYKALFLLNLLGENIPIPKNFKEAIIENEEYNLEFKCRQLDSKNFDEIRYLRRIALPIYKKFIKDGEFRVIKELIKWIGDNLLFSSNYKHSGALIILDGFGTCGPKARAYTALANSINIQTRVLHIYGHGVAESKVNGKWVMIDPMFYDYGKNLDGELKSAMEIHNNYLQGNKNWTVFGDFRYKEYSIENPESDLMEKVTSDNG